MRAGALSKRVTILKLNGEPENWETGEGWDEVATVWASIEPLRGKDFYLAYQAQAAVTHKVTIRYMAGIDASMVVKFNNRRLDVLHLINPEEKNISLELMCQERL